MTNRDPIDQDAMAAAVAAYCQVISDYAFGKPSQDDIDEADVAFEAVLLEQGVISPDDVIDEIFAVMTDSAYKVQVVIAAENASFIVWADGTIS